MPSQRSPATLFAAVSPLALLVIGIAVVAAALLDVPWYLLLALALVLWLGALAFASLRFMAGADRPNDIDPFALREPWRFYVRDAQKAQREVQSTIAQTKDGAVRDRLESVNRRLADATDEVWRISKLGQSLADGRRRIDTDDLRRQLANAEDSPDGAADRVTALRSQLESASRLDERLDATTNRLDTLDAQLKETVTRSFELSTASEVASVESLVSSVDHMVDELEALRVGLEETA